MNTPANVETLRTEAQKAADYRAEIMPILDQACEIISRARKEGLIIGFNISPDQYGRSRVAEITIVKPL